MKKNGKISMWLMIAAIVLAFAARLVQIVVGTDMTSGFLYADNGFLLDFCFYGLLIITFVGAAAAASFDSKNGALGTVSAGRITDGRAVVLGFGMLLIALCAAYDGLLEIDAISPSKFVVYSDFIFAAAMAVAAFVTLYQKEFPPALGFSYTVGGAYFTVRGVAVFLNRMVIASVPEYLIEALTAILAAIFFMLLAKLLSGNEAKNTVKCAVAFGITTAVITLSNALAVIVAGFAAPYEVSSRITSSSYTAELYYQANGGKDAYMMTYSPWVNVAVGIFAAAAVIVLLMKEKAPAANADNSDNADNTDTQEEQ